MILTDLHIHSCLSPCADDTMTPAAIVKAAKEAGLELIPFKAGFFLIVPCENPNAVCEELQKDGIFTVPFGGRGLRVSVASVSEEKCAAMPEKMVAAIKQVNG